jgi:hypothetical protein
MPQILLPIFPSGVTHITPELAFKNEDGVVTYFNATMPVFQHAEGDLQSFKMIISQFYAMGVVKQADLVRAFGVNSLLVKRAVKLYREQGTQGFFAPRKFRGPGVLTEEVCVQAQELLDQGQTPGDIAQRLNLKSDTIRKAILHGRLHRPSSAGSPVYLTKAEGVASSKSERSAEENDAVMG